jgi:hypothetical protein
MPDNRTLEDCQIPVFKTHPTPINVSIKPNQSPAEEVNKKKQNESVGGASGTSGRTSASNAPQAGQGCACVIL